jgi:hypothetical protein
MNCQEFWKNSSERSGHLDECPGCRASWDAERRLVSALRAAAPELSSAQAPPRVESRLLSAFRAQLSLGLRPQHPLWVRLLKWTSAAAAVAVLAVFLVRDRAPVRVRQPRQHAQELAVLGLPPAEGEFALPNAEFIALPNAAALESDEEANLVRVELPRSAMIAMGFDIRDENAGESIAADVMLGPDGLARAVRFLDD